MTKKPITTTGWITKSERRQRGPRMKTTKPSNNWTSTLIKLIQECPSETGQDFDDFMMDVSWDTDYSNEALIAKLKEML